jgi:hypothetical protein
MVFRGIVVYLQSYYSLFIFAMVDLTLRFVPLYVSLQEGR